MDRMEPLIVVCEEQSRPLHGCATHFSPYLETHTQGSPYFETHIQESPYFETHAYRSCVESNEETYNKEVNLRTLKSQSWKL